MTVIQDAITAVDSGNFTDKQFIIFLSEIGNILEFI